MNALLLAYLRCLDQWLCLTRRAVLAAEIQVALAARK